MATLETSPLSPTTKSKVEVVGSLLEQLQDSHRRILERVRPTHLQEVGLIRSLKSIVEGPAVTAANVSASCRLEASINEMEDLVAETAYRVTQEAVTNVVRHAGARNVWISAEITPRSNNAPTPVLKLEIMDDGGGRPENVSPGRGLKGMKERVLALGGRFSLSRQEERFTLSCEIPLRSALTRNDEKRRYDPGAQTAGATRS
jgi:signal transduction histidine kinase